MSIHTIFRNKRFIAAASVPVAVVASGALVWQSSYSAFSATTVNPTNNWSAGTVVLTDNDANTALFTTGNTNMKPGATDTRCINVTSTGSLASTVKLYGTASTNTNGLADNMTLSVEEGTGATNAACAGYVAGPNLFNGTLASFASSKTSFATGVSSWAPTGTGSETKSYKITYTLNAAAPNSVQGGTATLGFTWEAQNS